MKSLIPAKKTNTLSFLFVGDWGNNVPASQSESGIAYEGAKVAHQIAKTAAEEKPDFFAMLGDNFYDGGVSSVNDPLWDTDYRKLYSASSTQVPWLGVPYISILP